MKTKILLGLLLFMSSAAGNTIQRAEAAADAVLNIPKSADFEVNGSGDNEHWMKATWINIPPRKNKGRPGTGTRAKVLYSERGIYFLIECEDTKITSSIQKDNEDLWNQDVVEVFLKPEEDFPLYFEYELSPLGFELPLMVPNNKGEFMGWIPWHYEGERKIQKKTYVYGGKAENGAAIEGWRSEIFIPFALLKPLGNVPPKTGTRWRANMYRIDYDTGKAETWEWQPVGPSFHEYEKYGTFVFE